MITEGESRGRMVDDLGRRWEYRPDGWHCMVAEDDEHTWWIDVPYTWDEMVRDYGPVTATPPQEVEG